MMKMNASLDSGGETSLFRVALRGDLRATQRLLAAGADPNEICVGGFTAVHAACRAGSVEVLGALLEHGGDLEIHDCWRQTPVDWIYDQPDLDKRDEVLDLIECVRRWSLSKESTSKQAMAMPMPKYKTTRHSLGMTNQYRYLERVPKKQTSREHVPKQLSRAFAPKQSTFVESAIEFTKRKSNDSFEIWQEPDKEKVRQSEINKIPARGNERKPSALILPKFKRIDEIQTNIVQVMRRKYEQQSFNPISSPILRSSNEQKAASYDFSKLRRDKVFRFSSVTSPLDEEFGPPDMMSTWTEEWNTLDEEQEGATGEEWNTVDEEQEQEGVTGEDFRVADEEEPGQDGLTGEEWNAADEQEQEGTTGEEWNAYEEEKPEQEGATGEEWNTVDEEEVATGEELTVVDQEQEEQEGTTNEEWNTADEAPEGLLNEQQW